ncbi:MAG: L,D-transpeptidase family protein [Candidatus Harrisonbacteria bacterium]|nr:L,D-transpeptidase family protein [Candidatus Harrisonbacteria bacterium]
MNRQLVLYGFLLSIIGILSGLVFRFWHDQGDLVKIKEKAALEFYGKLADSQNNFIDAREFVFPDEQKFLDSKKEYVNLGSDFIEIDLRQMRLVLYRNGKEIDSFEILTKGREGSWWETPTGNYEVLNKETNHFSSIGKVWMPYSIQFYGNFFIHGWPYHENGTAVNPEYSGGCIRLSTQDAKKIFEFAAPGIPVLVLDEEPISNFGFLQSRSSSQSPIPNISAKSFLIINLATGDKILEKNSTEPLPVASLTKLMTGVVASELIYLDKIIKVTDSVLANALTAFQPKIGEYYKAFDLLYPLLMQSSNDSANVLAAFIGKDNFIKNMNVKAMSLQMLDTTFADPSGISNNNVSTAEDLSRLLHYIYNKRKFLFDITKGKDYFPFGELKIPGLKNYNEFYDNDSLIGVKNGETIAARQTLATVWSFKISSGNVPVAIIILGSDNRARDTQNLLDWLKENFMIM